MSSFKGWVIHESRDIQQSGAGSIIMPLSILNSVVIDVLGYLRHWRNALCNKLELRFNPLEPDIHSILQNRHAISKSP